TYHWLAFFNSSDPSNPATPSACADEPVVVSSAVPTIRTTQDPASGQVGVILNDSATLSGGVAPRGSILSSVYVRSDPGDCQPPALFTTSATVNSGNRTYAIPSGYDTPPPTGAGSGTYSWTAHYSGDGSNNSADSVCGDEQVVVSPATP